MGPTGRPETTVRIYHYTLRNIPEEQTLSTSRRNPKSRMANGEFGIHKYLQSYQLWGTDLIVYKRPCI